MNLSEITNNELSQINGGDCECSSAVKAIGGAVAAVANYFEILSFSISRSFANG